MNSLTVGSLFTGIGGFDLGFERAGLQLAWQVEIDGQCNTILAYHCPDATRFGDVRDVGRHELKTVDVICGGFPCQDLSIAGKREGLAGKRSRLWFEFHRIVAEIRPRWVVIENVDGLLSSGPKYPNDSTITRKGVDFAIILAGLVGWIPTIPDGGWRNSGFARGRPGYYNVAWRVLDAQYFGVAQRRRRVFIVGSLGDGSCAEILFESKSRAWDPSPSRAAGQNVAAPVKASPPSRRNGGSSPTPGDFIVFNWQSGGDVRLNVSRSRTSALQARQTPAVAYALTSSPFGYRNEPFSDTLVRCNALTASGGSDDNDAQGGRLVVGPLAAHSKRHGHAMTTQQAAEAGHLLARKVGVRRLTPTECERLQGFPDGWTAINGMSDSARYRMLGNAVCVPVAKWIGQRIAQQEGRKVV
jgi:DNA (cytosine-5)-methyltransferase 1